MEQYVYAIAAFSVAVTISAILIACVIHDFTSRVDKLMALYESERDRIDKTRQTVERALKTVDECKVVLANVLKITESCQFVIEHVGAQIPGASVVSAAVPWFTGPVAL